MKPSTRLWFATFSALVFAIGVLAGLVLDRTWLLPPSMTAVNVGEGRGMRGGPAGRPGGPPLTSAEMASAMVVRLDRELHLTDEQKRQLRTILEAWDARVRAAQDDVRQQFREDQQQLRQDVIKVLTPEQAARFDEIGGRALAVPVGRGGRGPLGRGRGGPGRE